jgi:hypothetical protein
MEQIKMMDGKPVYAATHIICAICVICGFLIAFLAASELEISICY